MLHVQHHTQLQFYTNKNAGKYAKTMEHRAESKSRDLLYSHVVIKMSQSKDELSALATKIYI